MKHCVRLWHTVYIFPLPAISANIWTATECIISILDLEAGKTNRDSSSIIKCGPEEKCKPPNIIHNNKCGLMGVATFEIGYGKQFYSFQEMGIIVMSVDCYLRSFFQIDVLERRISHESRTLLIYINVFFTSKQQFLNFGDRLSETMTAFFSSIIIYSEHRLAVQAREMEISGDTWKLDDGPAATGTRIVMFRGAGFPEDIADLAANETEVERALVGLRRLASCRDMSVPCSFEQPRCFVYKNCCEDIDYVCTTDMAAYSLVNHVSIDALSGADSRTEITLRDAAFANVTLVKQFLGSPCIGGDGGAAEVMSGGDGGGRKDWLGGVSLPVLVLVTMATQILVIIKDCFT